VLPPLPLLLVLVLPLLHLLLLVVLLHPLLPAHSHLPALQYWALLLQLQRTLCYHLPAAAAGQHLQTTSAFWRAPALTLQLPSAISAPAGA
jgi:hypothetical protein